MESEGAVTIPQLVESLSQAPPAPAGQRGSYSNVHRTHSRKGTSSAEKLRKSLFTDTYCNVCSAKLLYESQRISHYEGKKHAQKVRIYFQMHPDQEPVEALVKKTKTDPLTFQMDGNEVSDENKFCKLCNMVFSSPVVAESHYVGKIHAKKLKNTTGEYVSSRPSFTPATQQIKEEENFTDTPVPDTPSDFLSPQPEKAKQDVKIDLNSLSDNTVDFNDPDKYCKLCSAQFNNPLMAQDHYVGKRHARSKHRIRMMAEMEEEPVLSDSSKAAGPGSFMCPMCSITFTSIEMYQSHMQGNKHQTKENLVVNIIKNSKKSYDSFQDELADYIKVQKARGLVPKTSLRTTEENFENCDYEEDEAAPPEELTPARRLPYERPRILPPLRSRGVSNRLPYRPTYERNYSRGQYMKNSQYRRKYFPEEQHTQLTSLKSNNAVDSSEEVRHSSSDDSSGSYHRERRQKRKRRKEKRHRGSEDIKHVVKKRKMSSEDADSGKDDLHFEPQKEDTDTTNVKTVKHRKEKKCKAETHADKESKKHKRVKKKKDEDPRTEEEKLWDESILGF
ncbi:lysine-rich coiled-coil protein 1 isoform X3 [Lissotriton helveticus]